MKKNYFLFFFIAATASVFGQKIFVSGSIFGSQPIFVNDNFQSNTLTHYFQNKEGYAIGIGATVKHHRRFTYRVGIEYAVSNYKEITDGYVWGTDIDPNVGIISHSKEIKFRQSDRVQFPLEAVMHLGKKQRFYCGGGLIPMFINNQEIEGYMLLGNGTIEYRLKKVSIKDNFKFDNVALRFFGGYGISAQRLTLNIEPFVGLNTLRNDLNEARSKGNVMNFGVKTLLGIQKAKGSKDDCYKF